MSAPTPADVWNLGDYQKIAFENVLVGERLSDQLSIPAGARVLDVACGTGNTTLAAARRRADVVGIDIASSLIERATSRAQAEGLSSVRFQVGDGTALPFADDSFDFVLSTFGAVFFASQEATARELARVVRPGGTIALTAWSRQALPSDVYRLVHSFLPVPEGGPAPAYTWTDGPRAGALLNPYCDSVVVTRGTVDACFLNPQDCFENHANFYGPIMMGLGQFTPTQRVEFQNGFIDILVAHNRATDGTLIANYDYATIIATKRGRPA